MKFRQRGFRATVTATAAALTLSSCSVDPGSQQLSTLGAGVQTPADAGLRPLGDANSSMKTFRPDESSRLLVTDVRTGSHSGFDRVVFDLEGEGEPGWFIDFTTSASQQGSGNPIPFTGTSALNVNIDGTVYPHEVGKEIPNLSTSEGAGNITEVISAGTFEGRSQFIVGLNSAVPYSVQVLDNPKRLVIDLVQSS
ncbi:AMIN-like domain-containing (lipo)protein [Corynebacterium doosanense]|uniref:AMIN-like domain-containing (lipo)protein n=1 Tax=Corynebacterium doosanense TaxID=1121358 RepID=UPI00047807A5|nr:hypothetical protein [Corynebacterium doosanense]